MKIKSINITEYEDNSDDLVGTSYFNASYYDIDIEVNDIVIEIVPYHRALKIIPLRMFLFLGIVEYYLSDNSGNYDVVELEMSLIKDYEKKNKNNQHKN